MNILFAASEAVPFVKTGGLADVVGSLTKALRNRRQTCRVVLPYYEDIPGVEKDKMKFVTSFRVSLGWRNQYCGVFESVVGGVKYYFLDNEYYFKRRGHYGFFDDAERFGFFSKAVLEMLLHIDFAPDIIHCNDWQTAMVPVYLNAHYRHLEDFRNLRTVFTIHNIQYQGNFSYEVARDVLGLPDSAIGIVEYRGGINFRKGAIEEAEALTTVSPSYASEILDPWFGHGLDGLLREKQYKLTGILNGLDVLEYDPETDEKILQNYSTADPSGKAQNRRELQRHLGLEQSKKSLVVGMVSRLVSHKGLDLVEYAFSQMMKQGIQLVVLGAGDWQYEKFLREMVASYPKKFSVTLGFDDVLAHKIYSGADVFLMPSKMEPCGLSQMISLRYGTIPIVRATGGLNDTIRDFGGKNGNGYTFQSYNGDDMLDAINRARTDFADKDLWNAHIKAAMKCDLGWGKSANAYIGLYKSLVSPVSEPDDEDED